MRQELMSELDLLTEKNSGILKAEELVEFAKDPATHAHAEFEWDDSEAGKLYRVQQARQLIRVYVRFEPRVNKEVRAMISVPSDRTTGGGYRRMSDVLDHAQYRIQVVEEALKKIQTLRDGFGYLPELVPLFDKIDEQIRQFRQQIDDQKKSAG